MNPDALNSIFQLIVAISFLIIIHELGHFLVARLFGIEVEEFGIGYPPRLITLFRAGGTRFTLNLLPLGGFVRPKGENNPAVAGGLAAANPWVRVAVLAAGPAMNIVAGIVLYAIIFVRIGVPAQGPVEIIEVSPNSPAEQAGLQVGDLVMRVEGRTVDGIPSLQQTIYDNLGQSITLEYQRGGQDFVANLIPRSEPPPNEGAIGITMNIAIRDVSLLEASALGFGAVFEQGRMILTLPAGLIRGTIAPEDARLLGYKGIFDLYQNVRENEVQAGAQRGIGTLAFFAIITISLAILNLMPIPALDGGRILFTLPEILFRRRISPAYENVINLVSFTLLIILMIYINIQDFVNPIQLR